jgi:arylsulfatase A-like enzyme
MPTLLDLCNIQIPDTVEGTSFAPVLLNNEKLDREGVLIASYIPFADWSPDRGGREYRGVVTEQYTYVRSLNGPWMLYDNVNDPYQLNNLIEDKKYNDIKLNLDKLLQEILDKQGDKFLSGKELCKKYDYNNLWSDNSMPFID